MFQERWAKIERMRNTLLIFLTRLLRGTLAIVLSITAIIGLPILAFAALRVINEKCETKTIGTLPSPNKEWQIIRVQKFCTSDEAAPPEQFALLKAGQSFRKDAIFFVGKSNPEFDHHVILAKWIDDSNILVAAPEPYDFEDAQEEFREKKIRYDVYPTDPQKSRDDSSHRIINKPVTLKFRFDQNNGTGAPGLGCNLWAEGNDGEYLKDLNVRLSSDKVFAAKAWNYNPNKTGHLEDMPERTISSVLLTSSNEIRKNITYVTSAQVEDFQLYRRTGWEREDNYGHAWQLLNKIEHKDILTAIKKLKAGGLKIKVAFWLDNTEVIYSSRQAQNIQAIEEFERCLIAQDAQH